MEISFKDFTKLDIYSRTTIISILILMPFWYISIYLFHKQFYSSSDILLKIVFSFCLSLTWYFANLVLLFLHSQILSTYNSSHSLFITASVLSVFFISAEILMSLQPRRTYTSFLTHAYFETVSFYVLT